MKRKKGNVDVTFLGLNSHFFWMTLSVLVLFLLSTRLFELGAKPYHHDESLYAVMSWRYAMHGNYVFDPMLHGPLLYNLQAIIFYFFFITDYVGRIVISILGIGLPFLLIPFVKKLGHGFFLTIVGLVACSPIIGYFSRFTGMDILLVFLATAAWVTANLFYQSKKSIWLYLEALILACMIATKLNFLFYFFSFSTFFVFLGIQRKSIKETIPRISKSSIGAGVFFVLIFCLLYSSFGQNPQGIWDALYRKMVPYWMGQNRLQRVGGPFHYYLSIFSIYELPWFIFLCVTWVGFAVGCSQFRKRIFYIFMISLVGFLLVKGFWVQLRSFLSVTFHMNQPFHVSLLLMMLGLWISLTQFHLHRKEDTHAFLIHWAMTSLLVYSYAGEKVPWLATHVIWPFLLYAALVLAEWVKHLNHSSKPRRIAVYLVGIVMLFWQAWITIQCCIVNSSDPRERLVFTHTSKNVLQVVAKIESLAKATNQGYHLDIQIPGTCQSVWPFAWYLRNYSQWYVEILKPSESLIIIDDWENREYTLDPMVKQQYEVERYKLREWWTPDLTKASLRKFLRYYFIRDTFSNLGSQDLVVFIRKDVMAFWK